MRHENFNMKEHGFAGHLAEPEEGSKKAVLVIMGGEQSLLPGIKIAERFADYGITGLAVSLFGAEGLPEGPNQIPLEMEAGHPVMGMWIAYYNAYQNKEAEKAAWRHLEKTNARILLIAGGGDESWPAEYSVRALKDYLENLSYEKDVKVIVYPHGSHLNGMMPNRQREKKLYRMIPLIGLMYKTFGKYRRENIEYFAQTEREIIDWIR